MMLRIAATGEKATPPLFATIEILGKELFIKRLRAAIDKLV
jgi:glutamyl/glutaminyl-tRNA synthetase